MKIISHRGNIDGPDPLTENTEKQIDRAIWWGYDVEIDIWVLPNDAIYLGHDKPEHLVELEFLLQRKNKLWIHCKNKPAISEFSKIGKILGLHWFVHDKDVATLTSNGVIWSYPGERVREGIYVMPEMFNDSLEGAIGICTDYPHQFTGRSSS
jgi:hypothetical protein